MITKYKLIILISLATKRIINLFYILLLYYFNYIYLKK